MTFSEFEKAVKEQWLDTDPSLKIKVPKLTQPEFNLIDMLHKYHPSLSKDNFTSRKQLAWIYVNLGMRPLLDMLGTAQEMRDRLKNRDYFKGLYDEAVAKVEELYVNPEITDCVDPHDVPEEESNGSN